MSVLEQLAEFAAGVRAGDVPASVLDALRLHLFDTLAATVVGAATPEGRAIAALVEDTGSAGSVLVPGTHIRTAAPLAALATCANVRCTEIDDIDLPSCTTPGSVVVATALALAQTTPEADPADVLAALLVGYE